MHAEQGGSIDRGVSGSEQREKGRLRSSEMEGDLVIAIRGDGCEVPVPALRGVDAKPRGGPWTAGEKAEILEYCASDSRQPGPPVARMLAAILDRPHGLGHGRLRGRAMAA